jgi:hypothetical protein
MKPATSQCYVWHPITNNLNPFICWCDSQPSCMCSLIFRITKICGSLSDVLMTRSGINSKMWSLQLYHISLLIPHFRFTIITSSQIDSFLFILPPLSVHYEAFEVITTVVGCSAVQFICKLVFRREILPHLRPLPSHLLQYGSLF